MRQDAFIGLIALCGFAVPLLVWAILRGWRGLVSANARLLLRLFALGALMCIVVLMRKHIEVKIIMLAPREYWAYTLAQIDNELWEQVGKLVAMLLGLWIFKEPMRLLFGARRSALAIGYWTGLGYGFGEAFILAVLFILPEWGPFFGVQTFTPYMVGWPYVWERIWAMNLHAVMGALIGLGLYGYYALGSRRRLLGFFILAMLYHHFVDGVIITAMFVAPLAKLVTELAVDVPVLTPYFSGPVPLFAPVVLAAGLLLLGAAYHVAQPGRRGQVAGVPGLE